MSARRRGSAPRGLRPADLVVLAWIVLWVLVGLLVYHEVRALAALSETVSRAGRAVETTGKALGTLESLPLVGDRVRAPAEQAQDAGRRAQSSGRRSRRSIRRLSVVLGVAVAVLPTIPFVLLYLPVLPPGRRRRGDT